MLVQIPFQAIVRSEVKLRGNEWLTAPQTQGVASALGKKQNGHATMVNLAKKEALGAQSVAEEAPLEWQYARLRSRPKAFDAD